ncbi:hypothetical protein DMUE_1931 [Dictyocoela muelleri]|nr:hypothetical protein DMUE_1931 [Dictyocoela muelleri]
MVKSKIEETFFAGLHEKTKFDIIRHADRSFKNCMQILNDMDSLCFEKIKSLIATSMRKNGKQPATYESKNILNMKRNVDKTNNENSYNKKSKFCEYHKSRTHSNEECRFNKLKQRTGNNESSYALKEPMQSPRIIEIPFQIKNTNS